jgi:hypothetical protein
MTKTVSFGFELKALNAREFEGHGSVFKNVDRGDDIVVPGAFQRSLAQHRKAETMPLMFWMHQPDQVPGVWLDIGEDKEGLAVHGELVDTQLGNEMRTLLNKKAVRGLSIGYRSVDQDFDADGNRLLKEIDLWEVSIVSMAMNPLARVEAVKARLSAFGEYVPTEREFERRLREVGCSRSVSKHLVGLIFDSGAGGMPGEPGGDAGNVEEGEVLKSLEDLTARLCAGALKRR